MVKMTRVTMMVVVLLLAVIQLHEGAIDVHQLRIMAAKNNVSCILVFGDSSVDPGNNNHLDTMHKGNFAPYGMDFNHGKPTGRFSNGRLATDFIAEALGYRNSIPAFLDPHLENEDLLHGVSFASGGSGFDQLTVNLSNVISLPKQLEYFMHYKIHLRRLVGEKEAENIVRNAIFVLSMGTNDFLQNYYLEPTRSKQFTIEQYQDYLTSCMFRDVKAMHSLGARALVVVGMEPFGCNPLVKTLRDIVKCDSRLNNVALSFNSKIKQNMAKFTQLFGMKTAYLDTYAIINDAFQNPKKYGFTVTSKGCCGTGTVEYAFTCKGMKTCANRDEYMYWDAVHPTQAMHKLIAEEAVKAVLKNLP